MNGRKPNLAAQQFTDTTLITRCLAGDASAFGALIDRHRTRLERLLRVLLRTEAEIDDLWQETLLRAYFNLEQLRDPAKFGAWLCSIAINLARTYRSANTPTLISWDDLHTATTELNDGQPAPDVLLVQKEMIAKVHQAISDLPPAERETVLLVYLEGLSHKEVAARLGSSLSAVKVRVHRGRRRLQTALQAEYGQSLHHKERKRKMIRVTVSDIGKSAKPPSPPAEGEAGEPQGNRPEDLMKGVMAGLSAQREDVNVIVMLRAEGADRVLPIWIGPYEGESILLHLKQKQTPRPLTYDLFKTVLDLGQIVIEQAVVARLHENCFYANLVVTTGSTRAEVDCRPSDAINLAVRLGVPIFVAAEVMEQAGKPLDAPLEEGVVWESLLQVASEE
jgi:RNA polymerase sigma factor (sigma-70 family)